MEDFNVAGVIAADMTVSDKIRVLAKAGYARADIARLLHKRYQHVRNVLEADKLHPRRPTAPPQAPPAGVEEATAPFGGIHRLEVAPDGSVRLPAKVLAALGARPGGVLIAELGDDRLTILNARAALARIDALMTPFRTEGGPLASEELIAERRAEAARDLDG